MGGQSLGHIWEQSRETCFALVRSPCPDTPLSPLGWSPEGLLSGLTPTDTHQAAWGCPLVPDSFTGLCRPCFCSRRSWCTQRAGAAGAGRVLAPGGAPRRQLQQRGGLPTGSCCHVTAGSAAHPDLRNPDGHQGLGFTQPPWDLRGWGLGSSLLQACGQELSAGVGWRPGSGAPGLWEVGCPPVGGAASSGLWPAGADSMATPPRKGHTRPQSLLLGSGDSLGKWKLKCNSCVSVAFVLG